MPVFEVVEMQEPNQVAYELAGLITSQVLPTFTEDPVSDYINGHFGRDYTHYALLETGSELLGGAAVVQDQYSQNAAEVVALAVRPDLQRKGYGYGKLLLHNIAQYEASKGNSSVGLYCYAEDVLQGFYHRFGFRAIKGRPSAFVSIKASKLIKQTN